MAGKGKGTDIVAKAKRTVHRARGIGAGFGGKTVGPIIQGAGATLLSGALQGRIPYGGTLGIAGVGLLTDNPTLLTIAGMQLGGIIPNPLGGTAPAGNDGGEI